MEIYETPNQQVEFIKQFFIRRKKLLAIFFSSLLLIILGGGYWQHHSQVLDIRASDLYQEMFWSNNQDNVEHVEAKGKTLMQEYKSSSYAQLAALLMAKNAVAKNDLVKAEEYLRWVVQQKSAEKLYKYIATERLARVLQQRGELEKAVSLILEAKPDATYFALFQETLGDLYVAKGDTQQAKAAYLQALKKLAQDSNAPLLHMKLADLGVTETEIQEFAKEQVNA